MSEHNQWAVIYRWNNEIPTTVFSCLECKLEEEYNEFINVDPAKGCPLRNCPFKEDDED